MNNQIDFIIQDDKEINFNVENQNQNINFVSQEEENIDVSLENSNENVSMEIQDTNNSLNFELKDTPISTNNYNNLINKPSINSVVLINNKTSDELGLQPAGEYADAKITNIEIDALF